jgi:hypothetical protein
MYSILTKKLFWVHFWAFFSQTRLVALIDIKATASIACNGKEQWQVFSDCSRTKSLLLIVIVVVICSCSATHSIYCYSLDAVRRPGPARHWNSENAAVDAVE